MEILDIFKKQENEPRRDAENSREERKVDIETSEN